MDLEVRKRLRDLEDRILELEGKMGEMSNRLQMIWEFHSDRILKEKDKVLVHPGY